MQAHYTCTNPDVSTRSIIVWKPENWMVSDGLAYSIVLAFEIQTLLEKFEFP